jgi:HK97 family phage portal protein
MSLRARIVAAAQALLQRPTAARVPDWPSWLLNHPWMTQDALANHRDAFRRVPIVQAAIGQIQHDVASLPLRVYRVRGTKRTEIERADGNLPDLLLKANPIETGYSLRSATVGSLYICGNAYWFLQSFGGAPAEIWLLPAHMMDVETTENRGIRRYWYNRGVRESIDPRNMIHFRDYTPDDQPTGMARLEPVQAMYEAKFYALIWLREFFKKGGMVAGVWNVKDATRKFNDADFKAMMDRMDRLHSGYDKAWRAVIVEGLEFVRRGLTLSEMQIKEMLAEINAEICRAIGVPPWRLGIKEGANLGQSGANVDEQIYWTGTIKRTVTMIDAVLNERLCSLFGPDLVVEHDMSRVPALQAMAWDQSRSLVTMTGRPIMRVNEARDRLNLEPTGNARDDELWIPTSPLAGLGGDGGRGLAKDRTDAAAIALAAQGERREELRRQADVKLSRAEAATEAWFRAMFKRQRARVRAWLESHSAALGRGVRLVSIASDRVPLTVPEDAEEFDRFVRKLIAERGAEALSDIALDIDLNMRNAACEAFVRNEGVRVLSQVDETTTARIRDAIATGVREDDTLAGIITRVDEVFADAETWRAALIGRTETTRVYNFATNEAWKQTDGIVEMQEWLTARDGLGKRHAEDPAYAELDGQKVPLDGKFVVGTALMSYPGDPNAPVGESANCRCSLLPVLSQELAKWARWQSFMRAEPSGNGDGIALERIHAGT